jgi:hypothetical protein
LVTQYTIPIQPLPAQTFQATLGTQNCQITLQQMSTGLFVSLSIDGEPIISGKYCNDRVNLIRQAYLGFDGWLYFVDTAPGSTGETQPLTGASAPTTPAISTWTADSAVVTADSADATADDSTSGGSTGAYTSVPLGLDPNWQGLGSRFILVYESSP